MKRPPKYVAGNTLKIAICIGFLFLLVPDASSRVFVRWRADSVPRKNVLGVDSLVISWDSNASSLIEAARQAGFEVYVETPLSSVSQAAEAAARWSAAGLILTGSGAREDFDNAIEKLRASNPNLAVRILDPAGKQPLMRGQTITKSDGVLQVSSPTAQPWLDSNLSLARFDQEFHPGQPPLYSFSWEVGDSLQQANGVTADDYCLAVAESAAIRADLVLNLDATMQNRLAHSDSSALAAWDKVKACLSFSSTVSPASLMANIGVVTSDYDSAYEPMNLMGRHNLPYRVLRAGQLEEQKLAGLSVLTVFTAPNIQDAEILNSFARRGGTVVMVDIKGKFPWQSATLEKTAEEAFAYSVGKGRVVELRESVGDPETFAQDVRRLLPKDDVLVSAWNALTTIVIPYSRDPMHETELELLNYSEEPLRVQIRMKGLFSSIRYDVPGQACCESLTAVQKDGFTEFVVPSLRITGRVFLRP